MKKIKTELLVIGGGATGAGVARDLAMRGFRTLLVERGDLTQGTTGRYHGLLHSGARYAVRDPLAAKECIEENRILRRILPGCLEDTGGFFVLTPWDDPDYVGPFIAGCRSAGIPLEELDIAQMLREEPLLNPQIQRCFRVPDGSADSFKATHANAASAREHGAQILTYHSVIRLLTAGRQPAIVTGAVVHDLVKDDEVQIEADLVVNAAGAWSAAISGMAGIQVRMVPGKGTMLAVNHRILNTVVNRCRMCADADIIVPAHTVAVIGTTDIPVKNPDRFSIEPWEVRLLLEEGEKLVPGFKEMRFLRAWAGVRPLVRESQGAGDDRDLPRSFVLMDHEARDGVSGLITITGGKWTTYRKMAEAAADLVCQKLGVQRPCRTHLEPLPSGEKGRYHTLGAPLARVEHPGGAPTTGRFTDLVCECELATVEDVQRAILEGEAKTLDDIRRDVRLGMGPCQGGFCTFRAAGLLHSLRPADVEQTNVALRDFLQERWKGLLPILWGQQLRQERLDELILLSVLHVGGLPGRRASPLAATPYEEPSPGDQRPVDKRPEVIADEDRGGHHDDIGGQRATGSSPDLLVIGAGPAGLAAAWQAGERGLKARVIAKGWGSYYWNAGCVDVLGFSPLDPGSAIESPWDALQQLVRRQPGHPYALAGLEHLEAALGAVQALCARSDYPLHGSLERNWKLPTALGAFRPTCLAPETMIAGDMRSPSPALIVGFSGFQDFYPALIAANLESQGLPSAALTLDPASLKSVRWITARTLARQFESADFRRQVAAELRDRIRPASFSPARIGFPAVLGLDRPLEILHDLEDLLGLPVFEIPTLPPSIPGMRLHQILAWTIEQRGGRVYDGVQVTGAIIHDGSLAGVWSEAAARRPFHTAHNYLLATGGLLGGGLKATCDHELQETALGLPVTPPEGGWLAQEFLAPTGHPVFRAGLAVNPDFHPVDGSGRIWARNLYAAGSALAGCDPVWERSVEGLALATAWRVVEILSGDRG